METKENEVWRDIPGYEQYYQASSWGRIKSLDRTVVDSRGGERFYKGRVFEGKVHKGYRIFTLCINNKKKTLQASQLVAMAFLNHTPDGHTSVVDHVNGVKTDDRLSNLRIVSHRKNLSTCFRKDRKTLSSKYVGVSWYKRDKKWLSTIYFEGIICRLGQFDSELEASEAYQKALSKINNGTFNPDCYKPVYTSSYKGVSFKKASKKWASYVYLNGKKKHVGLYPTELEAYEALQKFKQNLSQKK